VEAPRPISADDDVRRLEALLGTLAANVSTASAGPTNPLA
jgi:hypothetical protein